MTTMTKAEYAAARGVSRPYISKLAKQGRLALTADGMVDVEATDALIAQTADPSRSMPAKTVDVPAKNRPAPLTIDAEGYDFQAARAKRETHEAQIAQMKEQQLAGRLVETQRVLQAVTDLAIATRGAIERIPDRIGMQLAQETDPARVYQLLENEIAQICADIADQAGAMAGKITVTE